MMDLPPKRKHIQRLKETRGVCTVFAVLLAVNMQGCARFLNLKQREVVLSLGVQKIEIAKEASERRVARDLLFFLKSEGCFAAQEDRWIH